jgi:hypothetical protein
MAATDLITYFELAQMKLVQVEAVVLGVMNLNRELGELGAELTEVLLLIMPL